jgi:ubiquinone/menaquinone biosynthesis C-methylase UbiE
VSFRRRYYNLFSHIYDAFVRLHSRDSVQSMRAFLAKEARLDSVSTVVDLCTGTGASALRMAEENKEARIIGIDFSEGMLRRACKKSPRGAHLSWIQADVSRLPVSSGSADLVTCTYAMYELSDPVREQALKEAVRILRPGGRFVMMEHLPPDRAFLKLLYLVRIHILGTKGVRIFAGAEEKELARFFAEVWTTVAPGGKTKAIHGVKPRNFWEPRKIF